MRDDAPLFAGRPVIRFRAYGHRHFGRLESDGGRRVLLIDMGRDGARLRLEEAPGTAGDGPQAQPPRNGARCVLHSGVRIGGQGLAPLDGLVEWRAGRELGIRFLSPCEVSVQELQRAIGLERG